METLDQEKDEMVIKTPPWQCSSCGEFGIRLLKYIGDVDKVSKWEGTCEICGDKVWN